MAAMTGLYGLVLLKLLPRQRHWAHAVQRCVPWLFACGLAALLFVLSAELGYQFRHDAVDMDYWAILTVIVALLFSIPYLGLQLRASGFLFNVLTDDFVPIDTGMWLLSLVVSSGSW